MGRIDCNLDVAALVKPITAQLFGQLVVLVHPLVIEREVCVGWFVVGVHPGETVTRGTCRRTCCLQHGYVCSGFRQSKSDGRADDTRSDDYHSPHTYPPRYVGPGIVPGL